MKSLLLIIVTCVFSVVLSAQSIVNPGFETAEGWLPVRLNQPTYLVPTPDGEGQCFYLRAPFAEMGSGYAHQELAAPKTIITRYRLKGKVRTRGVAGTGAYLYAYGKGAKNYLGYIRSAPLVGDTNWTEVTVEFIADESMDSIRIGCFLEGKGEAWFDDVYLEQVKPSGKKTSRVARKYLKEFFAAVEPQALDKEKINWGTLKAMANELAAGAQTTAEVHAALSYVLRKINFHSFLITPQRATRRAGTNLKEGETDPDVEYATGKILNDSIAYLTVPHLGSGHQPSLKAYADSLQRLISRLDADASAGWIVDLRKNDGGNCWPMLAGVGPLLGEGICGYFMARDGTNAQPWSYTDGASAMSGFTMTQSLGYELRRPAPRIAVLTGPRTMSSGEVTAVAFRELGNARSFGAPTGGYSTTNTNIPLSDGAIAILTVSVYADRDKNSFGAAIEPDVAAEDALVAAIGWLTGKRGQ